MPFLETAQGVSIHYRMAGEGPTLVFLHGWGMSGRTWRFQDALADRYQLVVPDLRGHGLSSAPETGYSLQDFAEDLVVLFRTLHLENAVLIAWSMGTEIALQVFPRLRERLVAMVFIAGTPRFTAGADYPHGLPSVETRGMALRLKRDHASAMGDFSRRMFAEGELQGDWDSLVTEAFGEPPARHVLLESLATLASADLRAVLPRIDLPVLLVHGSADTVCPPSASRYMAMHLPDAHLVEMGGAGHAPFLARPQEFAITLTEFLDGLFSDDRQR